MLYCQLTVFLLLTFSPLLSAQLNDTLRRVDFVDGSYRGSLQLVASTKTGKLGIASAGNKLLLPAEYADIRYLAAPCDDEGFFVLARTRARKHTGTPPTPFRPFAQILMEAYAEDPDLLLRQLDEAQGAYIAGQYVGSAHYAYGLWRDDKSQKNLLPAEFLHIQFLCTQPEATIIALTDSNQQRQIYAISPLKNELLPLRIGKESKFLRFQPLADKPNNYLVSTVKNETALVLWQGEWQQSLTPQPFVLQLLGAGKENIFLRSFDGQYYGLCDASGRELLALEYDSIAFAPNSAWLTTVKQQKSSKRAPAQRMYSLYHAQYGAVSNLLADCADLQIYQNTALAQDAKSGKYALWQLAGSQKPLAILPAQYDSIRIDSHRCFAYQNGRLTDYLENNKPQPLPPFDRLGAAYTPRLRAAYRLGKVGLIFSGNYQIALPFEYDSLQIHTNKNEAYLSCYKAGKIGIFALQRETLLAAAQFEGLNFMPQRTAMVQMGEKFGLFDLLNATYALSPEFDAFRRLNPDDTAAISDYYIALKGEKYGLYQPFVAQALLQHEYEEIQAYPFAANWLTAFDKENTTFFNLKTREKLLAAPLTKRFPLRWSIKGRSTPPAINTPNLLYATGKIFVVHDNAIQVYNSQNQQLLATIPCKKEALNNVDMEAILEGKERENRENQWASAALSPDGKMLFALDMNKNLLAWDTQKQQTAWTLTISANYASVLRAADFDGDGICDIAFFENSTVQASLISGKKKQEKSISFEKIKAPMMQQAGLFCDVNADKKEDFVSLNMAGKKAKRQLTATDCSTGKELWNVELPEERKPQDLGTPNYFLHIIEDNSSKKSYLLVYSQYQDYFFFDAKTGKLLRIVEGTDSPNGDAQDRNISINIEGILQIGFDLPPIDLKESAPLWKKQTNGIRKMSLPSHKLPENNKLSLLPMAIFQDPLTPLCLEESGKPTRFLQIMNTMLDLQVEDRLRLRPALLAFVDPAKADIIELYQLPAPVSSTPLLLDTDGDGYAELLLLDDAGNLHAYATRQLAAPTKTAISNNIQQRHSARLGWK